MSLAKRGWLEALLAEEVAAHRPDLTSQSAREAQRLPAGHGRARCYLRGIFRESGLLYGTPSGASVAIGDGQGREEILFFAVLRTFCRFALDVAVHAAAPPGPRQEQLLLLFAELSGRVDDAEEIQGRVLEPSRRSAVPQKVWRRVEEALAQRAHSLAADPYYGLVLHNGAVYADAHLFGRLALAAFARPRWARAAVERRLRHAALQKALLVKVLTGLVCAERPPSFPVRRAIARQIDDLQLPDDLAKATQEFARRAFEKAPSMRAVLEGVRSQDMRRFILEQTLLASRVEGRRSPREQEWTRALGACLGFTLEQVAALELSMAEFYFQHRDVVDVFTLSAGAEVMGAELLDTMSTAVRKNYRRLQREIRQTGELSVLLARAARGQALTGDEKRRMREQLIDVAKAVPALAIFAAPGGILLLIALAKVLPFDLLPSAFREEPEEGDTRGPR